MKIWDYFSGTDKNPKHMAFDILPIDKLWESVPSKFLNGFINHTKPLKVYIIDRYTDSGWKKKEIEKIIANNVCVSNLCYFHDDVFILSEVSSEEQSKKKMYMIFYFDSKDTDCKIGRFETKDAEKNVIKSVLNWLSEEKKNNKAKFKEWEDNGIFGHHEIPIAILSDIISF